MNPNDFALHILTMPIEELRERRALISDLHIAQHRANANGGDPSSPVQHNPPAQPETLPAGNRTCLTRLENEGVRRLVLSLPQNSYITAARVERNLELPRSCRSAIGRVLGFIAKEGHLRKDRIKPGADCCYYRSSPSNVIGG